MNKLLNNIECAPKIISNKYLFNGKVVPRVTEILSSMLHEEYLMGWANHLGFKRKSYSNTLKDYANVGTIVHDKIETYLKTGNIDYSDIDRVYEYRVVNGIKSFLSWYKVVTENNKTKILGVEDTLICEWFGGTCDLLIDVEGKTFLIDFKTSKNITYKHFLQLSAYKFMYNQQGINIDGLMVLQLSKDSNNFQEHILLCDNMEHMSFIDNCLNSFAGLVYAYYHRLNVEQGFKSIF